jgi:hypothetical protein
MLSLTSPRHISTLPILLKTPCCDASTGIWGAVTEAKLGLSALCGEDRRRKRDDLRHFPEVLGGDGQ